MTVRADEHAAGPDRRANPLVKARFDAVCPDVMKRDRCDDSVGARQWLAHEVCFPQRRPLSESATGKIEDVVVGIDADDRRLARTRQTPRREGASANTEIDDHSCVWIDSLRRRVEHLIVGWDERADPLIVFGELDAEV